MTLAIIFATIYIIWRAFWTLPFDHGISSMIGGIFLWLAELLGIVGGIGQIRASKDEDYPEKPDIPDDWYPHVDVFIATHNEPYELLYKTVNGCLNMDYPDASKVHIYLCDDTNREAIRELAKKMEVGYFGLSENKAAKAGNLNHAIANTSAPLIVTFDADMIPMHHFLMETVPYFFLESEEEEKVKVGFIQMPQSFYNTDLFQYNMYAENKVPNEQTFFFKEVNVGRNRNNTPIYAGSNTVLSREALDEVGGIAEGLITEDFATGMEIQAKGYRCYALRKTGASGLAPNDLKSLIKQRERWARGCIQTIKSTRILTKKGLTPKQKLSYMSSLLYWYTPLCRLMYVIAPMFFVLFNIKMVDYTLGELLLIWLPYYGLYSYGIRKASGNIRNARLSNIYDTIMFPYLIVPILLETVGFKQKKFVVTVKDNSGITQQNTRYAIPHIFCAILMGVAILKCISDMLISMSSYQVIILIWLGINFQNALMAVFFVMGRKVVRQTERIEVCENIKIQLGDRTIQGKTYDLADRSLSILLDFPEYIPPEEAVRMVCESERYQAAFKAKVIHVTPLKNQWKYAFLIEEIADRDLRQYYGILYDREPSLPESISEKSGLLDDFTDNIHYRLNKQFSSKRQLPRIPLEEQFKTPEGQKVMLYDFNYEYMVIRSERYQPVVEMVIDQQLNIRGRFVKEISVQRSKDLYMGLYKVDNLQELIGNPHLNRVLKKGITAYQMYLAQQKLQKKQENKQEDELDEWDIIWREGEQCEQYKSKKYVDGMDHSGKSL